MPRFVSMSRPRPSDVFLLLEQQRLERQARSTDYQRALHMEAFRQRQAAQMQEDRQRHALQEIDVQQKHKLELFEEAKRDREEREEKEREEDRKMFAGLKSEFMRAHKLGASEDGFMPESQQEWDLWRELRERMIAGEEMDYSKRVEQRRQIEGVIVTGLTGVGAEHLQPLARRLLNSGKDVEAWSLLTDAREAERKFAAEEKAAALSAEKTSAQIAEIKARTDQINQKGDVQAAQAREQYAGKLALELSLPDKQGVFLAPDEQQLQFRQGMLLYDQRKDAVGAGAVEAAPVPSAREQLRQLGPWAGVSGAASRLVGGSRLAAARSADGGPGVAPGAANQDLQEMTAPELRDEIERIDAKGPAATTDEKARQAEAYRLLQIVVEAAEGSKR